jgi:predicted esterase
MKLMMGWTGVLPLCALLCLPACKKHGGSEDDAETDGDAETDADATPVCEFADDGVCDEPVNCALGTDENDCVAGCASGENIHLFAAACAYRDPPEVPPDDGDPSGGTLHLTGVRDGTLRIAMGDAPGRPIDRHYRIYVPAAYDPDRSTPLVIMMPGHRVSHYNLASYTSLYRTADQNGFILVDAEQQFRGTGERRWAWFTDWDWAGATESNPDFEFIRQIVSTVSDEYNVDRSRVFLAGHSRGAAMAYIAALEMPDLVAGACVQSGFTEFGYLDHRAQPPWTVRKVPMVIMHGINDPDVPVAMGDEIVQRLRDLGWVEGEDFVYHRLANVPHRWQHWLNQEWYDFLYERPLPGGG